MKRPHFLITTIIFCSFAIACTSASTETVVKTTNQATTPSPLPVANIAKTDANKPDAAAEARKELEQNKAIEDFIHQKYKGWTLQGIEHSFGIECKQFNSPCDLHLSNGKQSKVVSIMIKEFQHPDGTSYWLVYEARMIDLARARIEEFKESGEETGRENALDNLTYEDCEGVIDAERDAADGRDYPDSYQD